MDFKKVWTLLNMLLDRVVELERENNELKSTLKHMEQDTTENTDEELY